MKPAKTKKKCTKGISCGATCISASHGCTGNKVKAKEMAKGLERMEGAVLERRANALAKEKLQKAKEAEPEVTATLKDLAAQFGGEMVGLEHRLKTEESLSRKIRDKTKSKRQTDPNKTPEEVAEEVDDALRYTMSIPTERYTEGVRKAAEELMMKHGYVQLENNWPRGDAYNGINAVFRSPNGTKYELQFHTPESFKAKSDTHPDYEIFRAVDKSMEEKRAAFDRMVEIADSAPMPEGILDLGIGTLRYRPFESYFK